MGAVLRSFMKVVLNAIKDNPEVERIARKVAGLFAAKKVKVCATEKLSASLGLPQGRLEGDLIIAIGGDGTILDTEASLKRPTPILGIHRGDVGFLTQVGENDVELAVSKVLSKRFTIEKRSKLSVAGLPDALNEVALTTATPSKIVRLRAEVNGRLYKEFDGDGIIVATPTGSTAYALSAGGPIVDPAVGALVLVPVCPYTIATRPLVIADGSAVKLTLLEGTAKVAVDGDVQREMRVGESLIIKKSARRAEFVKLDEYFYRKLSSLVR